MKKNLKIIIDVEFEDEDSLGFNIHQRGKETVDQYGLITILDGIGRRLIESEIVDEDDGYGDEG